MRSMLAAARSSLEALRPIRSSRKKMRSFRLKFSFFISLYESWSGLPFKKLFKIIILTRILIKYAHTFAVKRDVYHKMTEDETLKS